MKKLLFITVIVGLGLLVGQSVEAATWKDPADPSEPYKAGDCTMVSTRAEATAGKVYTLNPDNTYQLSLAYHQRWDRNARCDELQFHVDHSTPLVRLQTWLDDVAYGWYANIGSTHYLHQTISTARHEWFFVDTDGIHRIPDWLTALSWGLLVEDRLSVPAHHTERFYASVTIAAPLNFSAGQYADEIHSYWKGGVTDYSGVPARMASDIESRAVCNPAYCISIFESCSYGLQFAADPYYNLLDWRWMYSNPGCQD